MVFLKSLASTYLQKTLIKCTSIHQKDVFAWECMPNPQMNANKNNSKTKNSNKYLIHSPSPLQNITMVAQLQTYDCSSLIISSCNFALSTTATGNSSSAFDLQHPQPTTPSPSPNSSPAPSPHDSDDLYVEIDEMQITSSSLSSDPNNNRPNLPFGRRPMPFFDLPTSQTNQISRSILSKAIDNSSSQKSIINIINPNTLTDAELASSLIIQSLEYNKLESIKALSSIYTPLVSLGRCLMSAHDRMVVSEIGERASEAS